MTGQETLGTMEIVPDELRGIIETAILEEDPPKIRGCKRACPRQMLRRHRLLAAQREPMEPVARGSLGTTAPSIAPFNAGWTLGCCTERGESWCRDAKCWATWSGKAGAKRSLFVDGEGGPLSIEHCSCRSERARRQSSLGDPGLHRGRPTTANGGGAPTPVSGQRV